MLHLLVAGLRSKYYMYKLTVQFIITYTKLFRYIVFKINNRILTRQNITILVLAIC